MKNKILLLGLVILFLAIPAFAESNVTTVSPAGITYVTGSSVDVNYTFTYNETKQVECIMELDGFNHTIGNCKNLSLTYVYNQSTDLIYSTDFSDGNSTLLHDRSQYGWNATIGFLMWNTSGTGRFKNVASFNGTNQNVTVSANVIFNVTVSQGLTYEAWVNFADVSPATIGVLGKSRSSKGTYIGTTANGNLTCNKPGVSSADATSPVGLSTWTYIVCVWNTSGIFLYTNGILNATSTDGTAILQTDGTFTIGAIDGPSTIVPFNGSIMSVVVYNRSLRQNEILAHYQNNNSLFIGKHNITLNINNTALTYNSSGVRTFTISATPQINSITVNNTFFNFSGSVKITANVTNSPDRINYTIFFPSGSINQTGSMTAAGTNLYEYNFTFNLTNGNWSIEINANNTNGEATRINGSFIVDTIQPNGTMTRISNTTGTVRGRQIVFDLNVTDANFNNWTLDIYRPTTQTLFAEFNGTANISFPYNSTATDPVGNYTVNFTARDKAGNVNVTSSWLGLASVSVTSEFAFESVNFTTTTTAWGNETVLVNNSVTTLGYYVVQRLNYSGVCSNCNFNAEYNLSSSFPNLTVIQNVFNHTNSTINYTVKGGTGINFSYNVNLSGNEDRTEFIRIQLNVPNALLFFKKHDTGGVLWYTVQVRNVSDNVHVNAYARIATDSSNTFDSVTSHPQINTCVGGIDATSALPSCSTLSSTLNLLDTNNGNNSINILFDGPTNARNIRQFYGNFSDFLFRETIQGGGTSGAGGSGGNPGGGGGSGGGGGVFIIPLPGQNLTILPSSCPAGFQLINDTALGGEVCKEIGIKLPDISSSNTALLTIVIILGGIAYIYGRQSDRKHKTSRKKYDDFGFG